MRCEQLDAWEDKNTSDASTGQWMQAYTKRCRKCHARVEKNGGCNWIVCRCGHQFCYFCLCTEQSHHNVVCNAPPSAEAEGAKSELEYYMHYYDRWHGHCESQKLEGPLRQRAREQMDALMHCTEAPRALSEVQHLGEAVEVLVDCRRPPLLAPRHAILTPLPCPPHQTCPRVWAAGGYSSTPTHAPSTWRGARRRSSSKTCRRGLLRVGTGVGVRASASKACRHGYRPRRSVLLFK